MNTMGVALLVDEHRGEIATAWRGAVAVLGGEPALGYAVAPLLRELALALREEPGGSRAEEARARIAVLVRSSARPAQLVREAKLLLKAIWEALAAAGQPVTPQERIAVDGWVLDVVAECVDRLERVRLRLESLDRPAGDAAATAAARPSPPPLPRSPRA